MMTTNRREFLATASAALLGALAAGRPRVLRADDDDSGKDEKITPTADCLIVLWMAGGMAHTETFDPKRYTPFEMGLASNKVLSTFPSIPTAVDNIRISQGLEKIAASPRPRHADPHARGRRHGEHPPLAAPVPLAHRL